jgi:hypothetical protein
LLKPFTAMSAYRFVFLFCFFFFLLIHFIINYLLFIQFFVLILLSFLDSSTKPSTCSLFRLGESLAVNCILLTYRHAEFISPQEVKEQFACIVPKSRKIIRDEFRSF